jgi:7-carboxy-7-deazaguanine synthase
MIVNEIFYSLQGEGFLAGVPSVFIRLAGCPLHCKWCDTKYAWDERSGAEYSVAEIVRIVNEYETRYSVITGGEPMIKPDLMSKAELPALVKELKNCGKHVTIETSGIAFIPDMPCDLMSISPKLSNSAPDDERLAKTHGKVRLDTAILGELIDHYDYQLKFVVEAPGDIEEINHTIEQLPNVDTSKVLLMPQAATRDEFIDRSAMVAQLCKETGFTFSPRLQVLFWDNQKGV